jgi:hypothetical protein
MVSDASIASSTSLLTNVHNQGPVVLQVSSKCLFNGVTLFYINQSSTLVLREDIRHPGGLCCRLSVSITLLASCLPTKLNRVETDAATQIRRETSFTNEARNATKTAEFLANEPTLRKNVRIPKVYWNVTSDRVMTAEWVLRTTSFCFSV